MYVFSCVCRYIVQDISTQHKFFVYRSWHTTEFKRRNFLIDCALWIMSNAKARANHEPQCRVRIWYGVGMDAQIVNQMCKFVVIPCNSSLSKLWATIQGTDLVRIWCVLNPYVALWHISNAKARTQACADHEPQYRVRIWYGGGMYIQIVNQMCRFV